MNCQIAQNSLSAYLDRELSGEQMIALRSHLEVCAECARELDSLRGLKSSLGRLSVMEPREGFAEDVMRLVRNAPVQPAPRISLPLVLATSAAAAVVAVVLFGALFGGSQRPGMANDNGRFDAASDSAVTSPEFGSTAPLIPVGR